MPAESPIPLSNFTWSPLSLQVSRQFTLTKVPKLCSKIFVKTINQLMYKPEIKELLKLNK
jgi:hypothetical protein